MKMRQTLQVTMNNKQNRTWFYQLPDGSTAVNMKEAREKMNLGVQGFRALVRKEIVKKIMITETSEYEPNSTTSTVW